MGTAEEAGAVEVAVRRELEWHRQAEREAVAMAMAADPLDRAEVAAALRDLGEG